MCGNPEFCHYESIALFILYRHNSDSTLDSESEYQNDNTAGLPRLYLALIAPGIASQ